jgi:hypothetical protein
MKNIIDIVQNILDTHPVDDDRLNNLHIINKYNDGNIRYILRIDGNIHYSNGNRSYIKYTAFFSPNYAPSQSIYYCSELTKLLQKSKNVFVISESQAKLILI